MLFEQYGHQKVPYLLYVKTKLKLIKTSYIDKDVLADEKLLNIFVPNQNVQQEKNNSRNEITIFTSKHLNI